MWEIKHFKSETEAMKWIDEHDVQWQCIFVENQPFSIEYKPLKIISFKED